ncbi:MAG: 16S rRNA (uracil(1498)-N(3))-methyltransferase [Bacillota bacterium]
MARFFVVPDQVEDGRVTITGSDIRHISRVLRLGPGDMVTCVDGTGRELTARIKEINNNAVVCEITGETMSAAEPPIQVTLCQGLPKGDKMELIIQKCCELGVHRIIPVNCARTVVQLDVKKAVQRQVRWQRVAEEAAKQARRGNIPLVVELTDFSDVLRQVPTGALALVPWEEEGQAGFKAVLSEYRRVKPDKPDCPEIPCAPGIPEIWIFIGPEGGFTIEEADQARQAGCRTVTLGPRILRTETAAITALALVMYELGDIG